MESNMKFLPRRREEAKRPTSSTASPAQTERCPPECSKLDASGWLRIFASSRLILPMCLCLLAPYPALAQDAPLEITADQTLEWHRNDKKYIARGKAEAKQGLTQINAETLSADYRETDQSNFDIYRMTATDNVIITSQGNQAFGDKAVYELETGIATMTGSALKMTAPDQTITARDKFEYDVNQGRLSAYGNVIILRGEDKIEADKASAFFSQDGQNASTSPMGGRQLERFEGEGNVIVTTPTEILKGDRGVYKAATNTAEVLGNVKIIRGPNVLEGTRAEINLTTNVSRMFGNATSTTSQGMGKGRVKGVFYPGSTQTAPTPSTPTHHPQPDNNPLRGLHLNSAHPTP